MAKHNFFLQLQSKFVAEFSGQPTVHQQQPGGRRRLSALLRGLRPQQEAALTHGRKTTNKHISLMSGVSLRERVSFVEKL